MARTINMSQGGTYNQAPIVVEGDYVQGRKTTYSDTARVTVSENIVVKGRIIEGDKRE